MPTEVPAAPPEKVWKKGGTAYLLCRLTPEEVKTAAKNLAESLKRRRELEVRLDSVKQQIKGEMTTAEGDAQKFEQLVATESEHRMLPVDICFDFRRGVKDTVRTDTGEIVKTEAITDEDRQRQLFDPESSRRPDDLPPPEK